MNGFQDHFSGHASDYARFRPTYPAALFALIAQQAPARDCVWDAGCGNGQASLGLAAHFARVEASDASAEQIAQALPHPRVHYTVAPAEAPLLADQSVDAILVAQALHWFDADRFHAAVRRVARPGALLIAVMYDLANVSPPIDDALLRFYRGNIGPFWPGDRRHIDSHYQSYPWPWPQLDIELPAMEMHWPLDGLLGYLSTWSAVKRYIAAGHADPLPALRAELLPLWGDAERARPVRWPLYALSGRIS